MSATEKFLSHYGVKGMQWGKRKTAGPLTKQQIAKGDRQFEKKAKKFQTQRQVWAKGISDFKNTAALKEIGAKQKYADQGKKFKYGLTTNRKLYKQYNDEVAGAFLKHLDSKARESTNTSGTRQLRAKMVYMSDKRWKIVTAPVKHADDDVELDISRDAKGFILSIEMANMAHTDAVGDFLAHYGVKGMRWGKRGASKEAPSGDAARASDLRARAKTSKVKALSNKELQEAINRMQLEQNFKRLAVNERSAATRFIASTMLEIGKREVQTAVAKKVTAAVAKKVATGGAA